jgi:hypothetical protein
LAGFAFPEDTSSGIRKIFFADNATIAGVWSSYDYSFFAATTTQTGPYFNLSQLYSS